MAEVVYGEAVFVTRLGEANIQLNARDAESNLTGAWVTEAACSQGDTHLIGLLLDESMVEGFPILIIKIDSYSPTALNHFCRPIDLHQRRAITMFHFCQIVQ